MSQYKAGANLGVRHQQLNAAFCTDHAQNLPSDPKIFDEELKTLTVPESNHRKRQIVAQLKDTKSCQLFYHHYVRDNPNYALKFLQHCSEDFIKQNFPDVLELMNPQRLKILCEKCPQVAKDFYDSFEINEKVLRNYLEKEREYYNKLRFLLKVNGQIFLDITEKYFNRDLFRGFSSDATEYFMKHYRDRFEDKPELYTAWLLDVKTVAKYLNTNEIKDLVIKLAKAQYILNIDFTYEFAEPFIKALPTDERLLFKKKIFEEKSSGENMASFLPYTAPESPKEKNAGINIFEDEQFDPRIYEPPRLGFGKLTVKKKKANWMYCKVESCGFTYQSPLDILFNQYRFLSFEKTFLEFKKKMGKESMDGRRNMMLVLVSKSGGREESVHEFLKFLCDRHIYEPEHFRATVIKSLVKRCAAWRLSSETWSLFLRFAANLGLDGSPSNVPCNEGIHANVLKILLAPEEMEIPKLLWENFLKIFSTFKEYSLTSSEKLAVINKLPKLLLTYSKKSSQPLVGLELFLNTLDDYDIKVHKLSGLNESIAKIVRSCSDNETLLNSLFHKRIARKQLFKEYFSQIQTEDSYLNALKHDPGVLESGKEFANLVQSGNLKHDRFFRKLAKYFNEANGLAEKYLNILEDSAEKTPRKELARPIAILAGKRILAIIEKFDSSPKGTDAKRFASALKANLHLAKINIDINNIDWKIIGVKAIANHVTNCSLENVTPYLDKLLSWRKTHRLALVQSMRIGKEFETFSTVAEKKPMLALKTALWHSRHKNKLDARIWDVIIPLIKHIASEKCDERLIKSLINIKHVPECKKAKYCAVTFTTMNKVSKDKSTPMLCNVENILPEINREFIKEVVIEYLSKEVNFESIRKIVDPAPRNYSYTLFCKDRNELYFRIIAKYLLLCKDDENIKNTVDLMFDVIERAWDIPENRMYLTEIMNIILSSLKYNKVYLDTQYPSSLPVLEYFVNKMHKLLPKEKHFRLYVRVHLIMLYFKAIRQSIKNNVKIFGDLSKEVNSAAKIVGHVFGVYIGQEIVQLKSLYFASVTKLYHAGLDDYINTFPYHDSRNIFVAAIIQGILQVEQAHLLAALMYHSCHSSIDKHSLHELDNLFKNSTNEEAKFIFCNFSDDTCLRLYQ